MTLKTQSRRFIVLVTSLVALVSLAAILVGCSGGTGTQIKPPVNTSGTTTGIPTVPKSTVTPTWINPEVIGTSVMVPLDEVQTKINTHFKVVLEKGSAYFMAYNYGGNIQVRADICPPCRSVSYTLVKDTLVCDSCGTVFKAGDGTGIKGACVNYPKASVPFETVDDKIVLNTAELTTAYENTLSPGLP